MGEMNPHICLLSDLCAENFQCKTIFEFPTKTINTCVSILTSDQVFCCDIIVVTTVNRQHVTHQFLPELNLTLLFAESMLHYQLQKL